MTSVPAAGLPKSTSTVSRRVSPAAPASALWSMTANSFSPLLLSMLVSRAVVSGTERGLSLVTISFRSLGLSSVIAWSPDHGVTSRRGAGHLVILCQKGTTGMGYAALITWFAAVLAGLYMLTVWLIENDVTGQHSAPSQLRVPVIFTHLTLAVSGLCVWVAYLVLDRDPLAWTALGVLATVILLGLTMFARWLPVYREPPVVAAAAPAPGPAWPMEPASSAGRTSTAEQVLAAPAESHFPVVVIAAHGLLAGATLVLVLLTMLGIGGS